MQSIPKRILAIVCAALFAVLLTGITGGIWSLLLVVNLKTSAALPWDVVAMGLLLWLIWAYLDGKWWPGSTSEWRRRNLRATPVPFPISAWAVAAGLLSIVALTGFWIVLFQLVKVPGNALPDFSKYPPVTVALALFMASLSGGVTEEAGFRGYFQGLLEREVGGPVAIVITSLVMSPEHAMTQGFVWPTLLFYLLADFMFGTTAYLTKSILPGIVVHTIGLLTFFALIWPNDSTRPRVLETGIDTWFWIHTTQAITFGGLAIVAYKKVFKNFRCMRDE